VRAAVDARVTGTFAMRARVTTAVDVPGEHVGQALLRRWLVSPSGCAGPVCKTLSIDRERSDRLYSTVVLARTGPGEFAGSGSFYAALLCNGRRYARGSKVGYRITLTVARTTAIGHVVFAQAISATYLNRSRTDSTPCPVPPSHDAGVYTGSVIAGLPTAPAAAFVVALNPITGAAIFTDRSSPGTGGGPITQWFWDFGDPTASAGGGSTLQNPTHVYVKPGQYPVTLVVVDAAGLVGETTVVVTAPGSVLGRLLGAAAAPASPARSRAPPPAGRPAGGPDESRRTGNTGVPRS
jgi:hypothetical protein